MKKFKNLSQILAVVSLAGCSPLEFSGDAQPNIETLTHKKSPIAFVLGGGGAKGMAHVGVIEELTAAGINPDLIVGCSAGAIVGGLYSANPNIYAVKNFLMPLRRSHLLTLSLNAFPHGYSDGEGLSSRLHEQFQSKDFKDLTIRFAAVATNLEFGNLTIFDKQDIVPSIMASASFPAAFAPVKVGRYQYTDGGVVDPVPVNAAKELGGEYIIAVELHTKLSKESPENSADVLLRTLAINFNEMSKYAVQDATFLLKVPFEGINAFADGLNEQIYETGRKAAREALPKLCADLKKHFKKPICYKDMKAGRNRR